MLTIFKLKEMVNDRINLQSRVHERAEQDSHLLALRGGGCPGRAVRLETGLTGAPPSNTAPANCMDGQHSLLRSAVDSLYLSFVGCLFDEIEHKLIHLKALAQSGDPSEIVKAVIDLEEDRFEVLDRRTRNFAYIIKNAEFNIQLSKVSAEKMPMAYVQISSKALTLFGLIPTVQKLKGIHRLLGSFTTINVSRVDLCTDFNMSIALEDLPPESWISRSRNQHTYSVNKVFSGLVFGQGSPMSARLYDKTLQIKTSNQDYMRDICWENG
jgi:hypothetical protein